MNKKKHDKLLNKAIQHNKKIKDRQKHKEAEPKQKAVEVPKVNTSNIDTSKRYSKPEKIMASILLYNDIPFTFQERLEGSRRRFDFYIQEGIISDTAVVIEVNGEQHYSKGSGLLSSKMYSASVESDSFKRDYCKNNNIELIFVDAQRSSYIHIIRSISNIPLISYLVTGLTNKKLSKLKKKYFEEVD